MALDIIKPLKFEDNEGDFGPTETDSTQDYVTAKGYVLKENEGLLIDSDESGNMTFKDLVSGGPHTLADLLESISEGITESEHEALITFTHGLAAARFQEVTWDGWKPSAIICWTNSGKTKKLRSVDITYSGWKTTVLAAKIYDGNGDEITSKRLTGTLAYTGWKCNSATWVLGI